MKKALMALLLLGLVLVVVPLPGTSAFLTDRAEVQAGAAGMPAFTSGRVQTPAAPSVTVGTGGNLTVSWTATDVLTGGGTTPATGYQIFRYPVGSGGTGTQVCPAVDGERLGEAARSCSVPASADSYYAVVARFATSWRAESARTQLAVDVAGPVVTLTSPLAGASGGSGQSFQNALTCTTGIACGTAVDASAPVTVQYSLTRAALGAQATACWTGAAWANLATATCDLRPATVAGAAWTVPGAKATAYPAQDNTFALRVRATDALGNVTDTTFTFGY